jgi:Flp pilus assembly protein TadD
MHRIGLLVTIILCFTACDSHVDYNYGETEESSLISRILGDDNPGSASAAMHSTDILALSPEIQELLDTEIDERWSSRKRLRRLRELLYGEDQLNIHYDAANTLTATETFIARSGNCLSMTGLFIASARHIGLQAKYNKVTVNPTWDHEGNTMIRYEHIVAMGRFSNGGVYVIDFLPEFTIGDMRSNVISDEAAVALYYNNLGGESIIENRNDDAIKYLRISLRLDSLASDTWNNMGAAMRRSGENDLAEFSYLRAIHLDANNYSALSNLARFYKRQGREIEAAHFLGRVEKYRARNPYFHYFLAEVSFQEGDFVGAQESLQKSIRLKREDPDFYLALAKTNEMMGNTARSEEMLMLAEKYRQGLLRAPERRMNHRWWSSRLPIEATTSAADW